MGQEESRPTHVRNGAKDDDDGSNFVIVSNSLPRVFHFSPTESRLISYGIDKQTSSNYSHKSLGNIAVEDAEQILKTLVKVGAVSRENSHLYAASRNPEDCTVGGMRTAFQTQASEVGPNGIFVFHFSGHGITVKKKEWGLAPMDFDYSRDTYITAGVLSKWLNEIECKAKYILISLDSCYAGGIGKELTTHVKVNRDIDLYVISACTANETSISLNSLGHSIYTYFLSEYIARLSTEAGILPMEAIFYECQICSECLSSMLVFYNEESGLQLKTMKPQLAVRNIVSADGEDFPDVAVGRFQFAIELYDKTRPIHPLEDKSIAFLDVIKETPNGPLFELEKRDLLRGNVINTALCSMMYSIASIELACDTNLTKVKNANLCITAFIHIASTIDIIHHGVKFDEIIFFKSCMFYTQAMSKNKIKLSGMEKLTAKLNKRLVMISRAATYDRGEDTRDFPGGKAAIYDRGEDMPDSPGGTETLLEDFDSLKMWTPLEEITTS